MTVSQKRPLSAEDALSNALLDAIGKDRKLRLYDIAFGKFSAESGADGWWWRLQWLWESGESGDAQGDAPEQRVPRIIRQWLQDVTRYPDSPVSPPGDADVQ